MSDPHEVELKLELAPADRARLARSALFKNDKGSTDRLVADYFDTPDRALYAAGFSLRLRNKGDRTVQTVKADGGRAAGLFVRPEWERAIEGGWPIIDEGSGPITDLIGGHPLSVQFTTDVSRTVLLLAQDGASIELALDEGEVRAGPLSETLCELELELKSGSPSALFALARRINARIPLRLGVLSKSERGYRLGTGNTTRAVKAEPIMLDPERDAGAAFVTIAQSCLRQFRLNETLLMESGGVEALHQARVGLRRLRSAFSLFKPLLEGDDRADQLRGELRWLAAALGEVRNLDVLIERVEGPSKARLVEERVAALARVRHDLASHRARALMIDLAEWLAVGAWRDLAGNQETGMRSVTDFAAATLARYRRRVKKRGRHLAQRDDDHRHEARIEAKKLRYATDFFASLFPAKKARRRHKAFLKAMEQLQDHLGALNDQATAPAVFALHGIPAPDVPPAHDRARLLRKAEDALDRLVHCKRFWR